MGESGRNQPIQLSATFWMADHRLGKFGEPKPVTASQPGAAVKPLQVGLQPCSVHLLSPTVISLKGELAEPGAYMPPSWYSRGFAKPNGEPSLFRAS